MVEEYVIKVTMTPHPHDNPTRPYFWCILAYNNGWSNQGSGWAETPEMAFSNAKNYFTLPS